MELKKTNAFTPAGASASHPLLDAAFLANRLDERHEPTGGIAEQNEQRTNTQDGERM
jgi:hypothetical protein